MIGTCNGTSCHDFEQIKTRNTTFLNFILTWWKSAKRKRSCPSL